uniref:B30.2/SPRY domain-containing protein n=1 Tax=Globisporangium ultimum (strain ATCC 200006 / CBS 805.95 / DAOM BR144) TaxID=431595 RepID=K3W815_GLOUD
MLHAQDAPPLVSTPFGYGALPSDDQTADASHADIDADSYDGNGAAFTCVQFPWGRAYMHTELVATEPVFTFFALSKTERMKFEMPFALTSPGSDMVAAVRRKLELGEDIAITLVQTDSISRHEIKPDMEIGKCTIGADSKHPILVLQAPRVRFDPKKCSYYVVLQESNSVAIQVAKGFGSVLGNCEVNCGVKYWEVELQSARGGEGVFLGVASSDLPLNGSILNRGIFWGISCGTGHKLHDIIDYYTEPFEDGDVVGMLLDMEYGRLTFYRNGKNLGVAYRSIPAKRLCPVVSLTFVGQRVKLLSTTVAPLT